MPPPQAQQPTPTESWNKLSSALGESKNKEVRVGDPGLDLSASEARALARVK